MANEADAANKNLALWVTVIVEAIMILAVGAYNVYEVRRNSALVQEKIEGLAAYSSRQGEKLDRMTTALELFVGEKLSTEKDGMADDDAADATIEKAKAFLRAWKQDESTTTDP